jgi:hypothetical protein
VAVCAGACSAHARMLRVDVGGHEAAGVVQIRVFAWGCPHQCCHAGLVPLARSCSRSLLWVAALVLWTSCRTVVRVRGGRLLAGGAK